MKPVLKTCYVLLNRNFLDSSGALKINNRSDVLRKNLECSHNGKKNGLKSSPEDNSGKNGKLRKEEKVKHYVESQSSCGATSQSELSDEGSSTNDDETAKSRKLNCRHCDKSFSTHMKYLIHKRSHFPEPFMCSLCRMHFKYRQSFINHMKKYHPEGEPFLCEYRQCEKSFKTQKLLEMHIKMHLRYMCKFCKKLFAKKYHMRKHVLKVH